MIFAPVCRVECSRRPQIVVALQQDPFSKSPKNGHTWDSLQNSKIDGQYPLLSVTIFFNLLKTIWHTLLNFQAVVSNSLVYLVFPLKSRPEIPVGTSPISRGYGSINSDSYCDFFCCASRRRMKIQNHFKKLIKNILWFDLRCAISR